MTEAQLDQALAAGIFRLRINQSLRWSCWALGLGMALAAAAVVLARVQPMWSEAVYAAWWLLPAAVLAAALLGLWRAQPSALRVALTYDQRAGLCEHISTWLELRTRTYEHDAHAAAFAAAQRNATLTVTRELSPSRCLPLGMPAWSRTLWLGVLALGCAVLMPEQPEPLHTRDAAALGGEGETQPDAQGGQARRLSDAAQAKQFRVNPLSQTDLFRAQLMSQDDSLSVEEKKHLLAEIESKIGPLPESDLVDDVRTLLSELRRQTGQTKTGAPEAEGAQQVEGGAADDPQSGPAITGVPAAALDPAQALASAQNHFPDVAGQLARYYVTETGIKP